VIRTALAVVLAVALLSTVTPAIDEGRAASTAIHLDRASDRIERAAHSLRANEDPTHPDVAGARRTVRLRLPARSWTATGASLWIDGPSDRIGYRLGDRSPRETTLRGLDLRTPAGRVLLEDPGSHHLTLSLVRADGVGVVVRRGRDS
jgi:hypothetical protein